jgi:hypothetical protein
MRPLAVTVVLTAALAAADAPPARPPREALADFQTLIGTWKATGVPEGSRQERERGHWAETVTWEWRFAKDDVGLTARFENGRHFKAGELRYRPAEDRYQFTATTAAGDAVTFAGPCRDRQLLLERADPAGAVQRLVLTPLHANRFLYRVEEKPAGAAAFVKRFQVGATKEGFAGPGTSVPECVVSGGPGTMTVTYQGKSYPVCCGGCRSAFLDDPEKYLREAAARKK